MFKSDYLPLLKILIDQYPILRENKPIHGKDFDRLFDESIKLGANAEETKAVLTWLRWIPDRIAETAKPGAINYDLDGNPSVPVTETARQKAQMNLDAARAKHLRQAAEEDRRKIQALKKELEEEKRQLKRARREQAEKAEQANRNLNRPPGPWLARFLASNQTDLSHK